MRSAKIVAVALACVPASAWPFQTTDDINWPREGAFPAYPVEGPDGRRVQFSVSGGLYHDSNLFRLSDSADAQSVLGTGKKSDNVYRLGAGLKADLPVSRQRVLLDAHVDYYDYDRFGVLDHAAYRAGATWKWQAGNQLSGDVGYARRRYLASLAEIQAPVRDLVTQDHAFARGGFLVTPRWRIRGELDWSKYDHGEATRNALDSRITSVTAGLDYVTPANNSVGGQVKYSEGDFPNREFVAGSFVDNQYRETETSLVMRWMVTGKSTLDARLGYTSREHDQVPQRDFDGVTGRLGYDWMPGAKTRLSFAAWREIRSYEDISASYILSKGASFGPSWAPTEKIVLQGRLVHEKRLFEGDPGIVLATGPQREDTFNGLRLSAGYSPRRNVELAVGLDRGDRNSNVTGRDYDYTAVSANAKLRF